MRINFEKDLKEFDQTSIEQYLGRPRIFTVINPYFFNFLRSTFEPGEVSSPVSGVTVEWPEGQRLPLVRLEDFRINEDAQFFLHTYADMLVEEAA